VVRSDRLGQSGQHWLALRLCNSTDDEAHLEPLLSAAVATLVVAGTFVHPHHDRALAVSPLAPNSLDLSSRSDRRNKVCGCASVAHDLFVGDGQRRVVVRPLTLNGLRGGGRGEASVTRECVNKI
jgi:hypothetical protein